LSLNNKINFLYLISGFGGTFVVKNGTTTFHVIRNHWVDPLTKRKDIYKCIEFHKVITPSLVFATFVNEDRHVVTMNPGLKVVSTFNNKLQNCISNILFITRHFPENFSYPIAWLYLL